MGKPPKFVNPKRFRFPKKGKLERILRGKKAQKREFKPPKSRYGN